MLAESSSKIMHWVTIRTCFIVSPTLYMHSLDGQIALLSRQGRLFAIQNITPRITLLWCRILSMVSVHAPTMPLHIACLYHLSHLHSKLFMLAHELVEREPESPISWYAVGVWYLTCKKWSEARTYFRLVLPWSLILSQDLKLE